MHEFHKEPQQILPCLDRKPDILFCSELTISINCIHVLVVKKDIFRLVNMNSVCTMPFVDYNSASGLDFVLRTRMGFIVLPDSGNQVFHLERSVISMVRMRWVFFLPCQEDPIYFA